MKTDTMNTCMDDSKFYFVLARVISKRSDPIGLLITVRACFAVPEIELRQLKIYTYAK